MQQITMIVSFVFATAASAQVLKTDHMRLGVANTPPPHTVRSAADPAELDGLHTPTNAFDPLLEAELDVASGTYGHGATPVVTVRLKRPDGSLMAGTVYADDPHDKGHRSGQGGQGGEYTVALDNTPGEHFVDVSADIMVNGSSTHRGVSLFYEVGTGRVTLADVGPTRQDATTLYVPLVLNVAVPERYTFAGTLTAHGIVVASATTTAAVGPRGARRIAVRAVRPGGGRPVPPDICGGDRRLAQGRSGDRRHPESPDRRRPHVPRRADSRAPGQERWTTAATADAHR